MTIDDGILQELIISLVWIIRFYSSYWIARNVVLKHIVTAGKVTVGYRAEKCTAGKV